MMMLGGNQKFKEKYLESVKLNCADSTHTNVERILGDAKEFEDRFGKDLYQFTADEIRKMLMVFGSKTLNALKQRVSTYNRYFEYAVKNGKIEENPFDEITPSEYKRLVDSKAMSERYILRKELFENISYLINAQDQIIFALLFDGVMGRNYSDLTNLKVKDIDRNTLVAKLHSGGVVKLSKETYNLILIAIEEDTYDTYSDSGVSYVLQSNEYVVRVPKRPKGNELEPVRPNSIRIKIDDFKKTIEIEGVTGRSIYLSGVAERYLEQNEGEPLRTIEVEEWLKKYDISTNAQEMKGIIQIIQEKSKKNVE